MNLKHMRLSQLVRVLSLVRERGFIWLYYRLSYELKRRQFWRSGPRGATLKKKYRSKNELKDLVCVYDLDMVPISYNVFEYLTLFSILAESRNVNFKVIFINQHLLARLKYGSFNGAISLVQRNFRVRYVLIPACGMFENCSGFSFLASRKDFDADKINGSLFPREYSPSNYNSYSGVSLYKYKYMGRSAARLSPSIAAVNLCQSMLNGVALNRVVSITIRCSKYDVARNSSLEDWSKFSCFLSDSGYFPVVIPDTEDLGCFYPIPQQFVHCSFALNIDLRAALYSLALVNFGVANGPLILSTMNRKATTCVFKCFPIGSEVTTVEAYADAGVRPGEPYFWYSDLSFNSIQEDNYENLKTEFLKLIPKLNSVQAI